MCLQFGIKCKGGGARAFILGQGWIRYDEDAFPRWRWLYCVGVATPASAADMAVKAPPPPLMVAPVYNWSGFYIGANGGYAWSHQCIDVTAENGVAFAVAEGCRVPGVGCSVAR